MKISYLVIGIDCPGCGSIKDIKIPYSAEDSLHITTNSSGKIIGVKHFRLKYIDSSRIAYVYILEDTK